MSKASKSIIRVPAVLSALSGCFEAYCRFSGGLESSPAMGKSSRLSKSTPVIVISSHQNAQVQNENPHGSFTVIRRILYARVSRYKTRPKIPRPHFYTPCATMPQGSTTLLPLVPNALGGFPQVCIPLGFAGS